jgi:predicted nucleotidyltransferase
MSNISDPVRLRADHPLDADEYAALAALDRHLKRLQCPYMLVGATARNILLHNVFGKRVLRATQDVDIAISIDTWERFHEVKAEILSGPGFQPHISTPYRVLYKPKTRTYPIPIDILPFGAIATDSELVPWPPPDAGLNMNVMAFADVYECSLTVEMGGDGLELQIASLPGLVLLKLLAWVDKMESKQAQDVLRLIETYGDTGNEERLFSEKIDVLESAEFDFAIAGAHLLAEDALALASPGTIEIIHLLFSDPERMNRFLSQMTGSRIRLDESLPDQSGLLLEAFVTTFLNGGTSTSPVPGGQSGSVTDG